ncbi:hypothetical protein PUP68_17360 [Pseudomonas chlororaphis]|uniref:hypothetical protein n=1 Tax=Pseudomonas chlororaphis TaxID=587753 RepID=UPI0006A57687|nr:hypothetical protein [Pseudomonas chlororaphis]AZC31223.1 hypothetical protein C4K38_3263 [Pseudomonas chlororaphis subsp. piscium]WDG78131.1 hypothetical protein PUP77_27500 [Pseudomonas chlororaphis]WDG82633.1 hypothetical protein PUP68_17360 [Pseudomonas chlororaphis]WDG89018.1 hypothetical protein PUP49_17075 [Pseudomonas chlororaphis]SDS97747.1 hypothetical protein SAMN05216585_4122 [Pseudomonas chlororaphis]
MNDYLLDETLEERRQRRVAQALSLNPDEVARWVLTMEEDGSGMGYVIEFSAATPVGVLARVPGLGSDRLINIGPVD